MISIKEYGPHSLEPESKQSSLLPQPIPNSTAVSTIDTIHILTNSKSLNHELHILNVKGSSRRKCLRALGYKKRFESLSVWMRSHGGKSGVDWACCALLRQTHQHLADRPQEQCRAQVDFSRASFNSEFLIWNINFYIWLATVSKQKREAKIIFSPRASKWY